MDKYLPISILIWLKQNLMHFFDWYNDTTAAFGILIVLGVIAFLDRRNRKRAAAHITAPSAEETEL